MTKFTVYPATREDCDYIAEGIMTAVGKEICDDLADKLLPDAGSVKELFSSLAASEKSQYSYKNSFIAYDSNRKKAGVIIAYDGAMLHTLRRAFVELYNVMCGTDAKESDFDDETSSDEIYIDTLMVSPKYRRQGIGFLLINEVEKKFKESGKPIGLIVDHDNINAQNLYMKSGFSIKGRRKFCGVEMQHMQKII